MILKSGATYKINPAYLAGVLDSDGSLSITKRHTNRPNPNYTCMIQLTWKHSLKTEEFVRNLSLIFGGSFHINKNKRPSNYKNSSTVVRYNATGRAVDLIILHVFDYLILKKEQARNLIKARKLVNKKRVGKVRNPIVSEKLELLYQFNKSINTKNKGKIYAST